MRDIENVLKRVVAAPITIIEEPQVLVPQDEMYKSNEMMYNLFKVEELNRSLYLYH